MATAVDSTDIKYFCHYRNFGECLYRVLIPVSQFKLNIQFAGHHVRIRYYMRHFSLFLYIILCNTKGNKKKKAVGKIVLYQLFGSKKKKRKKERKKQTYGSQLI